MSELGIPDPAAGTHILNAESIGVTPGASDTAGPSGSPFTDPARSPEPAEPRGRRLSERALGGGMLKSTLAASLAARGGIGDGQAGSRFAAAVNVAADALRRAEPTLAAHDRQAAAATMQSLLEQSRAVMAARPDLSSGRPGTTEIPAMDLRDWDTRKADEARDAFLVTTLRLLSDTLLCLTPDAAADPPSLLQELSTNLNVHLDRLRPDLAAPAGSTPAGGNGASAGGAAFSDFVSQLRTLTVQLRP